LSVPTAVSLLDLADEDRRPSWESNSHSGHSEASDWLTVSVDLWWVDIPGQERAFFTSAKDASGPAVAERLSTTPQQFGVPVSEVVRRALEVSG